MVRTANCTEPWRSSARVDNPGEVALVVAPQVGEYKFTKVLMDGGSSINILYYDTFRRMNLTDKDLKTSSTIFHGVVPGKLAYPVGKIAGERSNFKKFPMHMQDHGDA